MPSRFEKFTERARKVLSLSQEEAQSFNHDYIGTEHILLGLVREGEGVAAKVLTSLGVDLDKVRSAVEYIIGRGEKGVTGEIGLTPRDIEGRTLYYGKGCDECNNTGYRGRTGIFELLSMDDTQRDLVLNRAATSALRRSAQEGGMRSLREDGLGKIYEGVTTIEEVVRETLGFEER